MKIYTGGPNVQHQAIRLSLPKATCKKDNGETPTNKLQVGGSPCVALHGPRRMRGGTSCSTCLAACLSLMQDDTPPPTFQDACLECMQNATPVHTCRSACFGCMRGDTSCLVDPPRAPHVSSHAPASCTDTTRASGYTQLVRWLTPRSDPMQRATSSFSVYLA
ncbi:hypothetical protein F2Q68_00008696 [Brassica cretica]|uniref:Uncharacterized protein n=2 Tax=Brassica cretica TaxID=69181 RepID=A0A8S9KUL8_BRACR|nr:hypothetical protein F2Q68_00008696 [Brassica cretica]